MKTVVLFNNKGGVGKTTLAFNLGHMSARLGLRTVFLDYDPQCNLSSVALSEDVLLEMWESPRPEASTVARCVDLVRRGKGDLLGPAVSPLADNLWILAGDLALSRFEQTIAENWPKIHATDNESAIHVTTSLQRLADLAGAACRADLALIDVGPNLGALNRASLLAADAVILPVAPDLFSLQGLKNVGPALREWREDWDRARGRTTPRPQTREFQPLGYVVQQHLARADRPVRAYDTWAEQIPRVFYEHVLGISGAPTSVDLDPRCLAMLKHFASLVPFAQQARKPMFDLKRADGIGGGHLQAVVRAREEFEKLAQTLRERLGL